MPSATIKLFLPHGDAKSLRTAEISNWSGKAVAAPRTELDDLLARDELEKAGVYILIGSDPLTNAPHAYIGEAEIVRERLKQQKTKEFWFSAIVFVSKDENLTKAHVRFLESRLLAEATQIGRVTLDKIRLVAQGFPNPTARTWKSFWPAFDSFFPSSALTFSRQSLSPPRKLRPAACSSVASRVPRREGSARRTVLSCCETRQPFWRSVHLPRATLTLSLNANNSSPMAPSSREMAS
jgi:hypothetical protein